MIPLSRRRFAKANPAVLALGFLAIAAALWIAVSLLTQDEDTRHTAPADLRTRPAAKAPAAPTPELEVAAAPTPAADPAPAAPDDPNAPPNPAPRPPADPMAEFRIDPFAGRVIEAQTYKGIEGAAVTALMLERGRLRVDGDDYPRVQQTVPTIRDGHFRFLEHPIARGEVLAWRAEHPGHASMVLLFPGGDGLGDRLRSTAQLPKGGVIAGRVVDDADKPVAGVLVGDLILGRHGKPGVAGETMLPSAWTTSDDEGAFRLEGVEVGKSIRVPVRAEGFVELLTDPLAVGREDVLIKLVRADAELAGVVLDGQGAPARGVVVEIDSISTRLGPTTSIRRSTATSADGSFEFKGLASGQYALVATLDVPESLGPGCYVKRELAVPAGQTTRVELRLPGASMVAGRFVDAATGSGVGGVRLMSPIDDVTVRARSFFVDSGDDGSFAFTTFVPDDPRGYEVRLPVAWGEGWFPLPTDQQAEQVRTDQDHVSFMEVRPGEQRAGIEVRLVEGGQLTGVVIEPDGSTPAGGVPVFVRGARFFATTTTDISGAFAVGVPAGERIEIESSSERGIGAIELTTAATNKPVRLALLAYGTLSGDLKDDAGKAIANVLVAVKRSAAGARFDDALRSEEKAVTTPEGNWTIANVAPGALTLVPEPSNGLGYAPARGVDATLEPGATLDDLHLVLQKGDFIEGRVLDAATGKPIAGATLLTNLREVAASSDVEGRFRLAGVPYDTALEFVTATKEGYTEETRRNVSIYDRALVLRLQPQARLRVVATDGGGAPVASYRVRVVGADGQARIDTLANASGGEVDLGPMAPGVYRAEVVEMAAGREGRTGASDFSMGTADERVVVRLAGEARLVGRVVRDGAPVAGATVTLLNPPANLAPAGGAPDAAGHTVRADAGGAFAIGPMPPGTYRVRATADGAASPITTVALDEKTAPIELALAPSPVLFGALTGPDGQPVKRATLFVIDASGAPGMNNPGQGRDGRYELTLPGEGTWQVAFSVDNTALVMTRTVSVVAGQRLQLDINFGGRVTLAGRLLANGAPAEGNMAVLLRSTEGEEVLASPMDSRGAYEVQLSPGSYQLWMAAGAVTAPFGQTITVAPEPERQTLDLSVRTGMLDVVAMAAQGAAINARLTLEAAAGGATVARDVAFDRATMRLSMLPAGDYRGRLAGGAGEASWSGWVSVRPGQPGVMTLEVP